MMERFVLCLRYPNGRVHERELEADVQPQPGAEFELVGRRWRVEEILPQESRHPEPRVVCTALTPLGDPTGSARCSGG